MSAYNLVKAKEKCLTCGVINEFVLQFKYAEVWQHEYQIGDLIIWGNTNIGDPNYKKVVVYAIAENCPNCGRFGQEYELLIENSKIISAKNISGKYKFLGENENFFIVTE